MEPANTAIELSGITKRFGSVVANDHIDLSVKQGEILACLAKTGSGKTTLMNMLSGIYRPDSGSIFIGGQAAVIRSPEDAARYKIGMIHQHFKLVGVHTAADNILLGSKKESWLLRKNRGARIRELCDAYGLEIDPDKRVYDMSVSEKQTVEILKVLYRGADILILTSPPPC